MSQGLLQDAVSHNNDINAYALNLSSQFDGYLEDLVRMMKLIMLDAPETTQNIRRINQVVAEYRRAALEIFGNFNSSVLLSELEEFAVTESDWEFSSIRAAVNSSAVLSHPFRNEIWAAVNSNFLIFPDGKGVKMLEPFVKDWEAGQIRRISDIIRTGYLTGQTTKQIAKSISLFLKKNTKNAIKAMTITVVNHVSNVARMLTLLENQDVVIGYEIISVNDSRRTEFCKHINHTKVKWSDKYKPLPPFHPRCRTTTVALIAKEYQN